MLKGFRQFIIRGNAIDLAVGVIIGAAFGAVVNALVKDLLTPLISAIFKTPDFSNLFFTIRGSKILYGDFLNAVISLVLIGFSVYFFVVLPMNTLTAHLKSKQPPEDPTTKKCPECLSEIPKDAKRCAFCTTILSV